MILVKAIVAHDEARVIGLNNSLPWDLPEDRKYFAKCTITTDDAVPRIESRSFQIRVVRKVG